MVSLRVLDGVRNELPFTLLEVDNPFRKDEPMTTRNGDNTGNSVPIGELRESLVDRVKLWTTSRDLSHDNQRSINSQ